MVAEPSGEEPGCESGRRGVGTLRSPQASVAQRRPHLTVNQASHTEVRVLPGALSALMVQADRTLPSEGRDRRFESSWEVGVVFTFQWGPFSRLGLTFGPASWRDYGCCGVVCDSWSPGGFLCARSGFRACWRCRVR